MVISYTGRLSGVLRAVAHRVRFVLDAPRILVLSMLIIMCGVFILAGCYLSRTIDQATASDVNNRSFAFTSGAVFNSALANASTTLFFTDNAASFTLCSGSQTATGTNKFGSCTLTVTNSNYSASAGPQINDVITLDPCDFDSDANTLTVSRGSSTATSAVATTGTGCSNVNQATAIQVNNKRFTFDSGAVFDTTLANVSTTLSFTNNAMSFELSSSGGTATGTNTFGSCILTVTNSDYPVGAGPQKNARISLQPCTFDTTNNALTVSNGSITATSTTTTPG